MPNITSISKTMRMKRTNIPQDVLAKLGFDAAEYKFISNEHSFLMNLLLSQISVKVIS